MVGPSSSVAIRLDQRRSIVRRLIPYLLDARSLAALKLVPFSCRPDMNLRISRASVAEIARGRPPGSAGRVFSAFFAAILRPILSRWASLLAPLERSSLRFSILLNRNPVFSGRHL